MAVSEGGHSDALLVNVRVDGLDGEQVGLSLESPEVAVDPHRGRKLRRPFPVGRSPVCVQDEVDEVMEEARRAGAMIVKAAQDTFYGGYAGYFQDPDSHLWEVVWNPQVLPGD